MPLDLTQLRSEDIWKTNVLRSRHAAGHYDEQRARARIERAVCDVVAPSIERAEIVSAVLSDTQRSVKR